MAKSMTRKRRYSKPQQQEYRTYGSLAYAPEPVYEERPKREVGAPRPQADPLKRERQKHRVKLVLAMLVVFMGAIVTTVSYAMVEEQKVRLSNMQDELTALQSANASLEAEITEQMSLDYVEKEATTRLGMSEPQSYQVVYIDVPKQSYTMQYSEAETEEPTGFSLASIANLFKRN